MGSVSRARFPSAQVSPARAAAPPGEEANQRLGGDESRARRGTGTGVARRARCACVSPRGSRTGHVARHGCRVGLRKAARGGRARGSVFASTVSWSVFSPCRGNDENVRARGILEECDCTSRVAFGVRDSSQAGGLAASLFTKVETLCLGTFPHNSSSIDIPIKKASRQPALLHLRKPPGRIGGDRSLAAAVPPADRDRTPTQAPHAPRHDVGLRQRRRGRLRAHPGQRRVSPPRFVFKRVSFPTSDAVFKRARARRGRRPPARFPRQISRSTDPASLFTP